jgi:hypothetical protein
LNRQLSKNIQQHTRSVKVKLLDTGLGEDALFEGGKEANKDKNLKDEFTNCEGFMMIGNQSLWPILGSILHPSYMFVNAKLMGQMEVNTALCTADLSEEERLSTTACAHGEDYLAAFGIGSATVSILIMASAWSYTAGLQNVIPQAHGAGNYEAIGIYQNRMAILSAMIFIPMLIPLFFCEYFFATFVIPRIATLA